MKKTLIATAALLAVLSSSAYAFTLQGRIVEVRSRRGLAGLSVRLTPSGSSRAASMATLSDRDGRFSFGDVAPAAYRLEAYQGTRVLYREQVNVNGDLTREIRLRRR